MRTDEAMAVQDLADELERKDAELAKLRQAALTKTYITTELSEYLRSLSNKRSQGYSASSEIRDAFRKAAIELERKDAEIAKLRAVVRDLLESYLATFDGNKDELALRAEGLLSQNEQLAQPK